MVVCVCVILTCILQELTNDKNLLQNQVYDQMNEISTLKSEVNQLKFGTGDALNSSQTIGDLKTMLQKEKEVTEAREKEVRVNST